jgi:hypothetical protein
MFHLIILTIITVFSIGIFHTRLKKYPIIDIIPFLILFLVLGLQNNVGTDYNSYIQIYKNIQSINSTYWLEIGNIYFITILKYIFNYPNIIFIGYSFFNVMFFYKFLKNNSKFIGLSLFIFITGTYLYPMSFSGLRQILAIMILSYSTTFLKENNKIKFITFGFLAFLFHKSAIIVMPVYYLSKFNFKKRLLLFTLLFSLFSHLVNFNNLVINSLRNFLINIIHLVGSFNYVKYIKNPTIRETQIGFLVGFYIIFLFIIILYKERLIKDIITNISFNLFYLYIISFLWLSNFPNYTRITWYFQIFVVVLIPNIIDVFSQKERNIFMLLIMIFYFIIFIKNIHIVPELQNYSSIL